MLLGQHYKASRLRMKESSPDNVGLAKEQINGLIAERYTKANKLNSSFTK